MRHSFASFTLGSALTILSSALCGSPKIGDTYAAVIAEKGKPLGMAGAGRLQILTFSDEVVTLKEGVVTAVRPSDDATSTVPDRKVTDSDRRRVAAEEAAAAATPTQVPATWTTDYDAALATARSQNRRVFLFFTGSDWCGWCIRLNREILSTPEFADFAQQNLILVDLDFPKRKEQPESEKVRNEKLARKFGVNGFPTVVVLNPQGKVIGRLGYQQGGPGPFITALNRL